MIRVFDAWTCQVRFVRIALLKTVIMIIERFIFALTVAVTLCSSTAYCSRNHCRYPLKHCRHNEANHFNRPRGGLHCRSCEVAVVPTLITNSTVHIESRVFHTTETGIKSPLRNAVLFLSRQTSGFVPKPAFRDFEFTLGNESYSPTIGFVSAGQRIRFQGVNGDPAHYVIALQGRQPNGLSLPEQFIQTVRREDYVSERIEVIMLRCAVHASEIGEAWVVPSDSFLISNEEGRISGKLSTISRTASLVVAHPQCESKRYTFAIDSSDKCVLPDFNLDLRRKK